MFLLLIFNFLFSLTYIITPKLLEIASIMTIMSFRMIFGGILILFFQFLFDKNKLIIKRSDFGSFFFIILFYIFFNFIFELISFKTLSGIEISVFYLISPILSLIVGILFEKEKFYKKDLYLIFFGILSMSLMLFKDYYNFSEKNFNIGYLYLFLSILFSIFSWYKIKNLLNKDYSIFVINGYSFLISGILFFICGLLFEDNFYIIEKKSLFFLYEIFLIIVGNVISYNLYGNFLKKYKIVLITISWFLSPIFLIIFNNFFKFEKIKISLIMVFILQIFNLFWYTLNTRNLKI